MNIESLHKMIKEELALHREEANNQAIDLKGVTLPLQAFQKIGVVKPEYLPVVLDKIKKGQNIPPVDHKYLADVFLKILATDDVSAMNQLFTAIRAISAKGKDTEEDGATGR